MYERHRANGCTDVARTTARFFDLAAVDFDLDSMGAGEAPEERHFHVWDDGSGADDETLDADELVGICRCSRMITQTKSRNRLTTWIEFAHVDRLESKGSHFVYFAHDIGDFFVALLPLHAFRTSLLVFVGNL